MEWYPICKCNNCDQRYIDLNPKEGALRVQNAERLKELLLMEKEWERFYACPECETDAYLADILDDTSEDA